MATNKEVIRMIQEWLEDSKKESMQNACYLEKKEGLTYSSGFYNGQEVAYANTLAFLRHLLIKLEMDTKGEG